MKIIIGTTFDGSIAQDNDPIAVSLPALPSATEFCNLGQLEVFGPL